MAIPPERATRKPNTKSAAAKKARDDALEDAALALAQPARFANTTHVMTSNSIVRVAFGESSPGATVYSIAVAMSSTVARKLGEHLLVMADSADELTDDLTEGSDAE